MALCTTENPHHLTFEKLAPNKVKILEGRTATINLKAHINPNLRSVLFQSYMSAAKWDLKFQDLYVHRRLLETCFVWRLFKSKGIKKFENDIAKITMESQTFKFNFSSQNKCCVWICLVIKGHWKIASVL